MANVSLKRNDMVIYRLPSPILIKFVVTKCGGTFIGKEKS